MIKRALLGLMLVLLAAALWGQVVNYTVGPGAGYDYDNFYDLMAEIKSYEDYSIHHIVTIFPNVASGHNVPYSIRSTIQATGRNITFQGAEGIEREQIILQLDNDNLPSLIAMTRHEEDPGQFHAIGITLKAGQGCSECDKLCNFPSMRSVDFTDCVFRSDVTTIQYGVYMTGDNLNTNASSLSFEECLLNSVSKASTGSAIYTNECMNVSVNTSTIMGNNSGICVCKIINFTVDSSVIAYNDLSSALSYGISIINAGTEATHTITGNFILGNHVGIKTDAQNTMIRNNIMQQEQNNILVHPLGTAFIQRNLLLSNGSTSASNICYEGYAFVNHNTIVSWTREPEAVGGPGSLNFTENILYGFDDYDNFPSSFQSGNQYCCFSPDAPQYVLGTGSFNADPMFVCPLDTNLPDWGYGLTWDYDVDTGYTYSPCIDASNPHSLDPDGSPHDIGAFAYIQENVTKSFPDLAQHDGLVWTSFPAISCTYNIEKQRSRNEIRDMLEPYVTYSQGVDPLLSMFTYLEATDAPTNVVYTSGTGWNEGLNHPLQHVYGYKLQFAGDVTEVDDIIVRGRPGDPEHDAIPIFVGEDEDGLYENWLGYFVPYEQDVFEAFGQYVNYIYSIKTQDWGAVRIQRDPESPFLCLNKDLILQYGDMVVIEVFYGAPNEFCWISEEGDGDFWEPEPTSFFTYTEKMDYTPVFIETDPANSPVELAVFVDSTCIGAAVVEDTLTQVRAYLPELQRDGDGGLSVMAYYGGRDGFEQIDEYRVYVPENDVYETRQIDIREGAHYYMVSLTEPGDSPAWNTGIENIWPNPFNPEATVRFSLAHEGKAELRVYNVRGQLVKTLVSDDLCAGTHDIVWDGRDNTNAPVASGVYMLQLHAGGKTSTRKALLLK